MAADPGGPPVTDEQSLLRAVLLSPADDLPRLVLADWLDEHGQPERAEFIRVQVEEARFDCHHPFAPSGPVPWCRRCVLRHRGRRLLTRHGASWAAGVAVLFDLRRWESTGEKGRRDAVTPGLIGWEFRRGFVAEVRGPLDAVRANLPELVGSHPVECVGVTDRDPLNDAGADAYFGGSPQSPPRSWFWLPTRDDDLLPLGWELPDSLYRRVASNLGDTHPSLDDAVSALSSALLAEARERAGLPPLPVPTTAPAG